MSTDQSKQSSEQMPTIHNDVSMDKHVKDMECIRTRAFDKDIIRKEDESEKKLAEVKNQYLRKRFDRITSATYPPILDEQNSTKLSNKYKTNVISSILSLVLAG